MVIVRRFWLPSLFQVVSGGEHLSAAEGAEVRLGRFWLLYFLFPSFWMRWFSLNYVMVFSNVQKKNKNVSVCCNWFQIVSCRLRLL